MKKLLAIFLIFTICITSTAPVMGIENIDISKSQESVSTFKTLDEFLLDYHRNADRIQKECGVSSQNNLTNLKATVQNEYAHKLALLNKETD